MPRTNFKILQEQAYEHIKDLIVNQSLEYNKIYSESKIALEIGISRTPVRDAVHRLYQEGLIDIIPNKGFILHKMTQQDVMETYEIRSAIEGYCAQKAAADSLSPDTKKWLKELKDSIGKQNRIYKTDRNVEAFAAEDQHFHYLLVSHSGNEAFLEIFTQYMYRIERLACFSLSHEGRMLETLKEHENIYKAIVDGASQKAYEAVLTHMKAPLNINLESVYSG